jgi:predicted histone-like DNA-binding protein
MSIQYKMIRREDYLNPEGSKKTGFYPQVVRANTVTLAELAQQVAKGKRNNALELEASFRIMLNYLEEELLNGNSVCFDGFGTFSLTAECRDVQDPADIRAESIVVKRVVFVPSQPLKKRLKGAKFKRVE